MIDGRRGESGKPRDVYSFFHRAGKITRGRKFSLMIMEPLIKAHLTVTAKRCILQGVYWIAKLFFRTFHILWRYIKGPGPGLGVLWHPPAWRGWSMDPRVSCDAEVCKLHWRFVSLSIRGASFKTTLDAESPFFTYIFKKAKSSPRRRKDKCW